MKQYFKREYFRETIRKLFKKGFFSIFIGQFLTKFVTFFGSIFVVRLLTKEEYGYLGIYENTYSYLSILGGFGLAYALIRYVILGKNRQEKYSIFHFAVKTSILINLLIVAVSLVTILLRFGGDFTTEYRILLPLLVLSLPFQNLYNEMCVNERAMFSPSRFAVITLVGSSALILGRILGAKMFNVYGVVFSQLIVYCILGTASLLVERRKYYSGLQYHRLPNTVKREVFRYSVQYMITNSFWTIIMLNSVFLLRRFQISAESIADYKVAYVFPANISILSTCLGLIVAPYFTRHETERDWVKNYLSKTFLASLFLVGAAAGVVFLFAKQIIQIVYGEKYLNVISLMRWLTIGAFINSGIRYPLANALAAMGKIKYNMIASAGGIVFQILINVLLIPSFGVYGTAIANISIYSAMSLMLMSVCYRLYYKKERAIS